VGRAEKEVEKKPPPMNTHRKCRAPPAATLARQHAGADAGAVRLTRTSAVSSCVRPWSFSCPLLRLSPSEAPPPPPPPMLPPAPLDENCAK
jgi:hypothetical protein